MTTTARNPIAPALLEQTKLEYQRKIKIITSKYDALILNFDQTPLPFICTTASHTWHVKDEKVTHL